MQPCSLYNFIGVCLTNERFFSLAVSRPILGRLKKISKRVNTQKIPTFTDAAQAKYIKKYKFDYLDWYTKATKNHLGLRKLVAGIAFNCRTSKQLENIMPRAKASSKGVTTAVSNEKLTTGRRMEIPIEAENLTDLAGTTEAEQIEKISNVGRGRKKMLSKSKGEINGVDSTRKKEEEQRTVTKGRIKKASSATTQKKEKQVVVADIETEAVIKSIKELKPEKSKGRGVKKTAATHQNNKDDSIELANSITKVKKETTKAVRITKGRRGLEKETTQLPAPVEVKVKIEKVTKKRSAFKKAEVTNDEEAVQEEVQTDLKLKNGKASIKAKKSQELQKDSTKTSTVTKRVRVKRFADAAEITPANDLKKAVEEIQEQIPSPQKKAKKTASLEDKKKTTKIKPNEENIKSEKVAEKKPRGRKRAAVSNAIDAELEDETGGPKPAKAKKAATPLNGTETKYNKTDFNLPEPRNGDKDSSSGEVYNLKISSWNVAGLRSWLKKDGLKFLEYEEPDIFCMQETKCTTDQLPEEAARIPGYHPYWLCKAGGYAGVGIYSKIMPINVEYGIDNAEFDSAGRIITAEYEKFYLVNVYVPNSGRKLINLEPRMRWEQLFQQYVQKLDALKPVIICGDMNVSHEEIDLANPKSNTRNAGFTKEEREKMTELLSLGFVDTFRHLYPQQKSAYTFWTYMGNARARNVGWRLDYFITSERLVKRVVENCMRTQCLGSDHCPITLFLKV